MKKVGGLILLLVVIIVVWAVYAKTSHGGGQPGSSGQGDVVTVKGYIGGEKMNLMQDPAIAKILHDKYKLDVQVDKRGSIEMVRTTDLTGQDFIWPSSQVALEIFKEKHTPAKTEILLNSPIVLYSWDNVTDALIKHGIVQKVQNTYYIVDFPKLVAMVNKGTSWKSIGVPDLYGNVTIFSTDPTKSNSGNMFSGLLANVLSGSGNQVVSEQTLPSVLPTVKSFFDRQGYMASSSEDIFTQYLNMGVGDKPIIVGYESQMIEFSTANSAAYASRQAQVRTLYPRPTVWSSHPFIALNDNGKALLTALEDPDIQRIAWQSHGFRSAVGGNNDLGLLKVSGVPNNIQSVIPMPSARVMDKIIDALGNN